MAAEPAFDETIHAPIRLRICGPLRNIEEIDYTVLRETLRISDASLSMHLEVLLLAEHVSMTKTR